VAFLRNSAVNLLNVHYGMHAVAMSGGGAFFTVYLHVPGARKPSRATRRYRNRAGSWLSYVWLQQRLGLDQVQSFRKRDGRMQPPPLSGVPMPHDVESGSCKIFFHIVDARER
jgi:hypothetical protein